MHAGVRGFLRFTDTHPDRCDPRPAATADALSATEQRLGTPLPTDLRLVLQKHDGGSWPSGYLLGVGPEDRCIESVLTEVAQSLGRSPDDPEMFLPFLRDEGGALLAFDRSAGPVPDTWPIVDIYLPTRDMKLAHRTFDGWLLFSVADWESPDYGNDFTLESYLARAQRHVEHEPDVAVAHATVAHAYRRLGEPEKALLAYVRAAGCVPPLPYCDWEALKLAVLLRQPTAAYEAAHRLSARAPALLWHQRETSPAHVADCIGLLVRGVVARGGSLGQPLEKWIYLLDQLSAQADEAERIQVHAVRHALLSASELPPTRPSRPSMVAVHVDPSKWWDAVRASYHDGTLRDDDLVLDPMLEPLRARYDFSEIVRIRRDF
ncbi:MAG: SMI1/KNR4 family protein [Deltaproteobacteria bacterium]|nr:SMI1/KNR4 family protein [Deltaproteobacteria bacterium]